VLSAALLIGLVAVAPIVVLADPRGAAGSNATRSRSTRRWIRGRRYRVWLPTSSCRISSDSRSRCTRPRQGGDPRLRRLRVHDRLPADDQRDGRCRRRQSSLEATASHIVSTDTNSRPTLSDGVLTPHVIQKRTIRARMFPPSRRYNDRQSQEAMRLAFDCGTAADGFYFP